MRKVILPAVLAAILVSGMSVLAQDDAPADEARLKHAIAELQEQILRESEEFTNEKLSVLREIERLRAQRDGYLISIESLRDNIRELAEANTSMRMEITAAEAEVAQQKKLSADVASFVGPACSELAELIDTGIPGSDTQALQREKLGFFFGDADFDNGEIPPIEINPVKTARKLFDLAGRLLARSRLIERYPGKALSASGVMVGARFLRVGEITSLYLTDDGSEAGILLRDPADETGRRYGRSLPGDTVSRLGEIFAKPDTQMPVVHVPVDISRDMVIGVSYGEGGLLSFLARGGPVMVPLLLVAALALALIFERLYSLRRESRGATRFANEIVDTYRTKGLAQALALAKGGRGALARVMKAGLEKVGAPVDIFEESLHEAALAQLPRLERYLSTIAVLATVAPLMGLLGTVTGMISAFDTITAFGASDPRLLSGGISEALITTETGLIIAIPVLLVHGFLSAKVDRITADIEQGSSRLIAAVSEEAAGEKADG